MRIVQPHKRTTKQSHCRKRLSPLGQPSGFTLAEVMASMVIVGVMLVAALNTVAASRVAQQVIGDQSRALLLAQQLMSEVLQKDYGGSTLSPVLGVRTDRLGFTSIDEYQLWSAMPPVQADGTVMSAYEGWQRSVRIAFVDPADLNRFTTLDTGIKYISVGVRDPHGKLTVLNGLRTRGRSEIVQN